MVLLVCLVIQGTCVLFGSTPFQNALLQNGEKSRLPLLPGNVYVIGNQGTPVKIVDHIASFIIICQITLPDRSLFGAGRMLWCLVS